jgi:hypothetical protein
MRRAGSGWTAPPGPGHAAGNKLWGQVRMNNAPHIYRQAKNPLRMERVFESQDLKNLVIAVDYFFNSFLRLPAAKPISPVPSNSMVAGSGTGAPPLPDSLMVKLSMTK